MAGVRATGLTELAGADFASDDLVLVFDLSANVLKKMTRTELLTSISGVIPNGDKGDIVVSGSGSTWTIDSGVVSYAKIQDVSAQYRLLGRSSSGSGDVEEITSSADVFSILGAADYASVRTLLSLVPGTDVQSYSALLAAFAAASAAADKLPYFTGATTVGVTDLTSFARTLLDDTTAAAAATTLGLGTGNSPQFTGIELGHATDTTITRASAGVLAVEGVNLLSTATGIQTVSVQVFTSSGTYTPTSGMKHCIIECVGGGGGGGGVAASGASAAAVAGGGGAGGYSRKRATAADVGASQSVTIGAGGAGGTAGANNGSNGGDTSVGVLCIAKGGSGGSGVSTFSGRGGLGGVAGTGDFTPTGASGGNGVGGSNSTVAPGLVSYGGFGGQSVYGGGGLPAVTSSAVGTAATNYGGGGGGAQDYNGASSRAGGAGASGVVIVTEYI